MDSPDLRRHVTQYPDGHVICRQGDRSYYTYILLSGSVSILRNGAELAVESRECAFLGEVSTLSGLPRTADLIANGEVSVAIVNSAELEHLVVRYPSIAIRLLKAFAHRLAQATNPTPETGM